MAKMTSRIFVAWPALYALIGAVTWPAGPNGQTPVEDWGDDFNQPTPEGWFVAGAPDSAATREWVTMGNPSQEERFVLRLTVDSQIPGRTRTQAMARIKELSDTSLDILTATWTVDGVDVAVTRHEIVGGFYFRRAELIAAEPSLSTISAAAAAAARAEAEAVIEEICGCAFVPRFSLVRGHVGTGNDDGFATVILPPFLRSIRWARYWPSDSVSYTAFTADELAAILVNDTGVVSVPYSGHVHELGVEHGADVPPPDVKAAAMTLARVAVNRSKSAIPDRAVAMTTPDGMNVQLGRIGTPWRPTGIDAVDAVLTRPEYNFRLAGTVL